MTVSSADLRSRDFRRILLIKLSAVGDAIHTIPFLNALRKRYPDAQVDWLVRPHIGELLRHHPAINTAIEFPREAWSAPWLRPVAGYAALAAKLRAQHYDLVVDLQGQLRTALLALATGAPVRIGFDRPRANVWSASTRSFPVTARQHAWQGAREGSWLAYTHHVRVPSLDVHAVDRYLTAGALLGFEQNAADFAFPVPPSAGAQVDMLLHRHGLASGDLVVMAPGTAWETKRWRSAAFAEVARHFMQKGFAVVLIGSKGERDVCDEVALGAPGAVNLSGETTLSELAALLGRAAIIVSNDSGPMHLAAALDRPVIGIFGPTDPVWVGPYGRADAVLQAALPCAPCYLRQLSRCHHAHACMHTVSAGQVIERMEALLQGDANPGRRLAAQAAAR